MEAEFISADKKQKIIEKYSVFLTEFNDDCFFFRNFSVEYRNKNVIIPEKTGSLDIVNGGRRERSNEEQLLSTIDMDQYGSTPPRTRIKNKNRDWDRRQKM